METDNKAINIICPTKFGSLNYLGSLMKQILKDHKVAVSDKYEPKAHNMLIDVTVSDRYNPNAHNILIGEGVTSAVYKRRADVWWTDTPAIIYRSKEEIKKILETENLFKKHYTVSEFCKEIYREQNIPVEDTVIPRPVNPILFNYRTRYEECEYDIAFIGYLCTADRKNVNPSIATVLKNQIKSVFVTNALIPKRPFITKYSFGSITDEQKAQILSKSKFLLFPSSIEGFGLPPLEAMSAGCVPIYSDVPAHNEFATGIPIKPHDKIKTFAYGCRIIKYVITKEDIEEAVKYALGIGKEEYEDLQSKCIERAKYMYSLFKQRLNSLIEVN